MKSKRKLLEYCLISLLFSACVYSPPYRDPEFDETDKTSLEEEVPATTQYVNKLGAPNPNCAYSHNCHCKSPGKTLYWKHAYCLKKYDSQDSNNDEVQSCTFLRDTAKIDRLNECDKNYYWRIKRCEEIYGDVNRIKSHKFKAFKKCSEGNKSIPRIIRTGK